MTPTQLLYMSDMARLNCDVTVLSVDEKCVVLDQTVFYPQGGGQPFDHGTITNANGTFIVDEVRMLDGVVRHSGHFESGMFAVGDVVMCHVDVQRRQLNNRLHSAGHVIDFAVQELGLGWTPIKGYHFSDGPYVEYLAASELSDDVKARIESACADLISQNAPAEIRLTDGHADRVVAFGELSTRCGGTHVTSLSEIGAIQIRKMKKKGDTVRISYELQG
jgi:Ser-tRNA(Ala) deacylase AlaX